ncbi:MAG TPA: DUF1573 domain-containing protein [Cytophagaceae bacterium]|jgi:hypothetical protein|nr:DUF1573 domain-containing protein [Cytophagaceae bacterium]
MKKYIFFFTASAFLFLSVKNFAQEKLNSSKIGFEKTSHDFGNIKEENGKVSHEFKFTNTSGLPITINNVQASCGCTTPSWTRSEIEPGKTGYVKAQYDPTNRPNAFTKTLSVSYSIGSSAGVEVLTIKGTVLPKPKTTSDLFPIKNGNLRFTSDYLNLFNITTKESITKEFKMFNDGKKNIHFTVPSKLPEHLTVKITPLELHPKDTGYIKISYDPKGKNDLGYVYDILEIMTDDSLENKKKLYVVANISQYFPPTSKEDSLKMPKLSFDRSTHNFGTISQGDVVTTNFVMTNNGKSDLKIYKTKASCGCTASEPEKTLLKPGEKTNLKVTFNSAGKSGQDSKAVTVYSNDPTYSEAMVIIKSDIQVAQIKDTSTKK